MKRILCAVDRPDVSVGLVQYARAVLQWRGDCLTVIHVVPTVAAPGMRRDEWDHRVLEQLRKIVDDAGVTGEGVHCEIESGEPAPAIVARALAIHADTIVIGTGARHDSERLLIGPVTEAVVRRASVRQLRLLAVPEAPEFPTSRCRRR